MRPEDLAKLSRICADFKRFRDVTEDGQGNNLHDIKNTFDYVAKTVEQYQLSGTKFGYELITKINSTNKVLSQLWLNLQELEKTIGTFIDNQKKTNSQ